MSVDIEDLWLVVLEIREEVHALRLLIEARAEGPLASEAELVGERGDPIARFDPITWPKRAASEKGRHFSLCSAEYLDHLSRALDAIAAKDVAEGKLYKGKPSAPATRRQAALARRWALRKRLGWEPPPALVNEQGGRAPATDTNPFADDEDIL